MRIRISAQGGTDLEASIKELQELQVRIQYLLDGRAETISVDAETGYDPSPYDAMTLAARCAAH